MAKANPQPEVPVEVDLDLDVIAPPPRTFRMRGRVYQLPGDVPVPTLIRAAQLRERFTDDSLASDEDQRKAVTELFDLVMDLIRSENEAVPEFNVSVTQLMYLVGLILSGREGVTMDEALVETLSAGAQKADQLQEDADHPPTSRKRTTKAA